MSDHRNLSIRKELQDYLRCCEYLLSTAHMPNGPGKSPGLSEDEEGIVEYYAVELSKLQPRQRRKLKYRHSVLEYIRLSEVLLKADNLSGREHEQMQQMLKQVATTLLHSGPGANRNP
ncbi:MAG TPA: hypothetical protein VJQ25_12575 [Nitrospira sp.]|nr:hypothetical protein [Nitrospira sp.]